MKGRILTALLFAGLMFLGIKQLGDVQSQAVSPLLLEPVQFECTLPPPPKDTADAKLPQAPRAYPQAENTVCSFAPVCSSNGTPLLSLSYYRAAYQAFHFSDCAG